ncbi:MAG: hypothetical protein GX896_05890, partial [Clostridiales bacterium]|nr:hypothetical protein [Clostridiales bacterium]
MIKKIAAGVVALVLSISMLTGCNEGKNSSSKPEDSSVVEVTKSKLTIDGKEVDTDGLVMMTINDEYEVGYEEYRYYFLTLM